MDAMLQMLSGLDPWAVYALLALLVFGESAAVVALVMPGEVGLLVAGVAAARGYVSLPIVIGVAVAAAICGQAAGYELGRRSGLRLLRWPLLRRYRGAVEGAVAVVARHGGVAVFLGRWMNVGRIVVPLLVGAGRMHYRTFTLYNVLGAVAWVLTFVLLGTAAGASLDAVRDTAGRASWWLTGIVGVCLAGGWAWRRSQRRGGAVAQDGDIEGGAYRCTVMPARSSPSGRGA